MNKKPDAVDTKLCDFSVLVEKDYYIDRTHILHHVFFSPLPRILLKAPPGFGKTTIMSMIKAFCEVAVNEDGLITDEIASRRKSLFMSHQLNINEETLLFEKHFAKYPVLSLSFKNFLRLDSEEDAVDALSRVCHETINAHAYLINSDRLIASDKTSLRRLKKIVGSGINSKVDLILGLMLIKKCLYQHFNNQRVVVMIDDYDTPVFNATDNNDAYVEMIIDLMDDVITNLGNQEEEYLKAVIISGIRFDYPELTPDLTDDSSVAQFNAMHSVVPICGLLESDVDLLFSIYNIDPCTAHTVKRFYASYNTSANYKLYSPWAILTFLQFRKLKNYWLHSHRIDTGDESFPVLYSLKAIINNIPYDLKYKKLISALNYNNKDFFRYLICLGYISFGVLETGNIHLTIPTRKVLDFDIDYEFYLPPKYPPIFTCAKIISQLTPATDCVAYSHFLGSFKEAYYSYGSDIFIQNPELLYFLLFAIAIKARWFVDGPYKLLRPMSNLLIIVTNKTAIYFLVTRSVQHFTPGLLRILNERLYDNRFLNNLQVVNKILIGFNFNISLEQSILTLNVLANSNAIENVKIITM